MKKSERLKERRVAIVAVAPVFGKALDILPTRDVERLIRLWNSAIGKIERGA